MLIFFLLSLANAAVWLTFASISSIAEGLVSVCFDSTAVYFGYSSSLINFFSVVYMVCYAFDNHTFDRLYIFLVGDSVLFSWCLGSFFSSMLMNKFGLRKGLLIAALITSIGSLIRLLAERIYMLTTYDNIFI